MEKKKKKFFLLCQENISLQRSHSCYRFNFILIYSFILTFFVFIKKTVLYYVHRIHFNAYNHSSVLLLVVKILSIFFWFFFITLQLYNTPLLAVLSIQKKNNWVIFQFKFDSKMINKLMSDLLGMITENNLFNSIINEIKNVPS